MTFKERLKSAIDHKGMTQKSLAQVVGITEASMSRYMNGSREPSLKAVVKMSDVLDVSTDWLLKGDARDYEQGWNDALNAVQDALKKSAVSTDCAWR